MNLSTHLSRLVVAIALFGAALVPVRGQVQRATADQTITQRFALQADISPAQITANQNNYEPTGLATTTILRLTTDAARTLTGLAGGADGRVLILANIGSYTLTLADESSSSTAANRFALPADYAIQAGTAAVLIYDATGERWRVLGNTHPSLTGMTGILPVANGGTGVSTFGGTNTILYTTSAGTISSIATGNNGFLVTNGSGVPSISSTVGDFTVDGTNNRVTFEGGAYVQGSGGAIAITPTAGSSVTTALSGSGANNVTTDGRFPEKTTSTDASADGGPYYWMQRNSASPANNDYIGGFIFGGKDSAGNDFNYGVIRAQITNTTNGAEAGRYVFTTTKAGAESDSFFVDSDGITTLGTIKAGSSTTVLTDSAGKILSSALPTTITQATTFSQNLTASGNYNLFGATDANNQIVVTRTGDSASSVALAAFTNTAYLIFQDTGGNGLRVYDDGIDQDILTFGAGDSPGLSTASMRLKYTTPSTSTTTGSAVFGGGIGVADSINAGGDITVTKSLAARFTASASTATSYAEYVLTNDNRTGAFGLGGSSDGVVAHRNKFYWYGIGGGTLATLDGTGAFNTAGTITAGGELSVGGPSSLNGVVGVTTATNNASIYVTTTAQVSAIYLRQLQNVNVNTRNWNIYTNGDNYGDLGFGVSSARYLDDYAVKLRLNKDGQLFGTAEWLTTGGVAAAWGTYGSFSAPAIAIGDPAYGAYVSGGSLYFKSGSAYRFRNAADSADLINIDNTGNLTVNGTADSASIGQGSGVFGGGLSVASQLRVGGNATFSGNLNASGSGTFASLTAAGGLDGPLTGSMTGTAQGPVFNVQAYGATVGDSTDDRDEIQAAIDAAATAGGGVVYFPAGTYVTATEVTVSSDAGIVLRGAGPASVIQSAASSNGAKISITGDNVTVEHLTLDGLYTSGSHSGDFGLINITDAAGTKVRFTIIKNSLDRGIRIRGSASDIEISHNTFTNHFCSIHSISTSGSAAPQRITINENQFLNNWGTGGETGAIKLQAVPEHNITSSGHMVSNNRMINTGQMGVELWGRVSHSTLLGNIIEDVNFGISLDETSYSTAIGNTIRRFTYCGIENATGSHHNVVGFNVLDGADAAGTPTAAVGLITSSPSTRPEFIKLIGNFVKNIDGSGIKIQTTDDVDVVENTVENTTDGITLAGSNRLRVNGNKLIGPFGTFIFVDSYDGNIANIDISSNTFVGNTTDNAITLYDGDGARTFDNLLIARNNATQATTDANSIWENWGARLTNYQVTGNDYLAESGSVTMPDGGTVSVPFAPSMQGYSIPVAKRVSWEVGTSGSAQWFKVFEKDFGSPIVLSLNVHAFAQSVSNDADNVTVFVAASAYGFGATGMKLPNVAYEDGIVEEVIYNNPSSGADHEVWIKVKATSGDYDIEVVGSDYAEGWIDAPTAVTTEPTWSANTYKIAVGGVDESLGVKSLSLPGGGGISGADGAVTVAAGGADKGIALNPTGTGSVTIGTHVTLAELGSSPAAPAANGGVLYLKDNGSGKTQLVVRFNSGAEQVIATEP